jgi:4-hydroxybenzoate polyprenyltransferase
MARQPLVDTVTRDASAAGDVPARSLAASLVVSLRPGQWTKNLVVFAGLLFGRQLFEPRALAVTVAAAAIFCALSGVIYLLNDIADREADRRHPLKSKRPIASGQLSPAVALGTAVALGFVGLALAFWLRPAFGIVAVAYVALQAAYSASLKHIVIIDVLTIAIGFVLRAVAGAVVIDVAIGHWLLICTVLLALFMALSKRRHELTLLAGGATEHRRILGEYSPYLLDQMIAVVTASTLVAYIFYTISPETVKNFGTEYLALTIPFPLYGIFRYLYLVHQKEGGGSPAEMLLTDRPLLLCVGLWAAAVILIVYGPGELTSLFGLRS